MRPLAAFLVALTFAVSPAAASAEDLIVRFRSDTTAEQRAAARALAGVTAVEPLPLDGAEVVSAGAAVDALRLLGTLDVVEYAEPDAAIRRHATPSDPFFAQQWALSHIGAPAAWELTTGTPGVTVAVVDAGADLGHPDLAPNLWRNAREVAGNERDDDRNGLVDDVHGYDFVGDDGAPTDADGHGTHVAGTIAARGDDGVGVTGVAWQTSLLPLRVLDGDGEGTVSDAVKAYAYARRAGARVVNVSWGGITATRTERDMLADLRDVLVVASAGNEGLDDDRSPTYPCAYALANVVCVGASGRDDALAEFSNFGRKTVDLAAPGVGIASAVPGPDWALESGTSMAAPHVSGAAALLLSRTPQASVADLRAALLGTAAPVPALAGRTVTGGRLDVAAAVAAFGGAAGAAASETPPADVVRPRLRVLTAVRAGRGVRARVRCSEACDLRTEVVVRRSGRSIVLARGRGRVVRAGTATVRITASARVRRSLRGGARLRVRGTDPAGNVGRASRAIR